MMALDRKVAARASTVGQSKAELAVSERMPNRAMEAVAERARGSSPLRYGKTK